MTTSERIPARPEKHATVDPQLVAALTGNNAGAERAIALRTRRAVYNAAVNHRSEQHDGRRSLSIAFLISGALTVALAPALWAGIDDLLGGETLLDLPGMMVALCVTMFAAVLAVLYMLGHERRKPQTVRNYRR